MLIKAVLYLLCHLSIHHYLGKYAMQQCRVIGFGIVGFRQEMAHSSLALGFNSSLLRKIRGAEVYAPNVWDKQISIFHGT